MNLLLSTEENEVADAASTLLHRALLESRGSHDPESPRSDLGGFWQLAAEAGWFGLGLSLDDGGVGGGMGEQVALFREIGRRSAPGPILGTVLAAHVAARSGQRDLCGEIVSGHLRLGLAWPEAAGVAASAGPPAGPWQGSVSGGSNGLVVISRSGAALVLEEITDRELVDSIDPQFPRERVFGDLELAAWTPDKEIFWRAVVLLAATLVGLAEAGRDQSVEYAKNRVQYGQPIGAFQAVKHRCADMAVRCESAWSVTCYAGAALAAGMPSVPLYASSAKVIAARSAIQNSVDNVQNHGAMGFTDELGAHKLLRQAHALDDTLIGSTDLLDLLRQD